MRGRGPEGRIGFWDLERVEVVGRGWKLSMESRGYLDCV